MAGLLAEEGANLAVHLVLVCHDGGDGDDEGEEITQRIYLCGPSLLLCPWRATGLPYPSSSSPPLPSPSPSLSQRLQPQHPTVPFFQEAECSWQ